MYNSSSRSLPSSHHPFPSTDVLPTSSSSSLPLRNTLNVNIGLGTQFRTLKDIVHTPAATKQKKINLFGIVVSNTFKKVCNNGNSYRTGYSIIDDTLIVPDSSSSFSSVQPVVVQFFAPEDLCAHPFVVAVGDILRIQRADIDIFAGKVQANVPTHFGGYIDVFHMNYDGTISVIRTVNVPSSQGNHPSSGSASYPRSSSTVPTPNFHPDTGIPPPFLRNRIPFTSFPLPEQARVKKLFFWWNNYRQSSSMIIPRDHYSCFGNLSTTAVAYGQGDRYIDSIACVIGISEPLQQIIYIIDELDKYTQLLLQYKITTLSSITKLTPVSVEIQNQLTQAYQELVNYYSNPYQYLAIDPSSTDYSIYIWDTTDNGSGNGYRSFGIEVPSLQYTISTMANLSSNSSSNAPENNNSHTAVTTNTSSTGASTILTNAHCMHQGTVLRVRIDVGQVDVGMLRLKIGTWVRLRNIKIRFDTGPPGYELNRNYRNSSSDTKAYLGENSGILRIDYPEKCYDIINLLRPQLSSSSSLSSSNHQPYGTNAHVSMDNSTLNTMVTNPNNPSPSHDSNHTVSQNNHGNNASLAYGTLNTNTTYPVTHLSGSSSTSNTTTLTLVNPVSSTSLSSSSTSTTNALHALPHALPDIQWITKVLVPEIPLWNIKNILELVHKHNCGTHGTDHQNPDPWNTLPKVFRVRSMVFAVRPFDYREFCQPKALLLTPASSLSHNKRSRYENDHTINGGVTKPSPSLLTNRSSSSATAATDAFPSPVSSTSSSPPSAYVSSSTGSISLPIEQQWANDELSYDTEYFYYFALRLRDIEAGSGGNTTSSSISSSSNGNNTAIVAEDKENITSLTSSSSTYPMIDGIVFGEDGETFLPGLPPCNLYENPESADNLRLRTKELFRPNTAIECCLKMYRTSPVSLSSSGDKNSKELPAIRFRIFKTVLLLPNVD